MHSIRTQFLLIYLTIITAVLLFFSIYFPVVSRDLTYSAKQSSILSQTVSISNSIAGLDSINEDSVNQIMSFLETDSLSMVTVMDADGWVLYSERSEGVEEPGQETVDKCVESARQGSDCFQSTFKEGAFASAAASPIMNRGHIMGTVFAFEYDLQQGGFLLSLQKQLWMISLVVFLLSVSLTVVLTGTLTRRLRHIVNAMASVRQGEYSYRIDVSGKDEVSRLAGEFNSLMDRLQSNEEIRRRFVSDASHELKTPLASIKLLSESILQSGDMDEDTVREFVSDIGDEANRLARTTDKLLSLTRLDNRIVPEREPIDVGKTAWAVLRVLKPLAKDREIKLLPDISKDCVVLAGADGIYAIIMNLVENAIKYNMPGGSVSLRIFSEPGFVRICVEDTGIGIPEDDLPNIFDRFYRVDKARSREMGGSGLGLSIVKSTVEDFGGEVSVRRLEPKGTGFDIQLPACPERLRISGHSLTENLSSSPEPDNGNTGDMPEKP